MDDGVEAIPFRTKDLGEMVQIGLLRHIAGEHPFGA